MVAGSVPISFLGRRVESDPFDDRDLGIQKSHLGGPRNLSEARRAGKLDALPSEIREGEALVLKWDNIRSNDVENDFLGLICADPGSHMPSYLLSNRSAEILDSVSVADASTGQASARGSIEITRGALIDMRCDYLFGYYAFDLDTASWRLAAESNPVRIKRVSAQHGRLSLTGNAGEMAVTWTSASSDAVDAVVIYGTSSGSYSHSQKGSTFRTYAAEDLCASPANISAQRWFRHPGYFHTIVLKGLTPGTRYFYRYGAAHGELAQEASFMTPPPPGSAVNFLAFGDLGAGWIPPHPAPQNASREAAPRPWGGLGSSLTAHRLAQEAPNAHFLLHVGDLAYALGAGHVWERFHALIEPAATHLPYLASIGNHEYDYVEGCVRPGGDADVSGASGCGYHPPWGNFGADSGGECGVPAAVRFLAPSGGNTVFWYSLNYGNVHIVQLSSEHDCGPGSPQRAWLEKDLYSVDRCSTPWVVLTTHRPLFSSLDAGEAEANTSAGLRSVWGDLLSQHNVDLVITGHIHSYERTCPLLPDGTCTTWDEPTGESQLPAGTNPASAGTGNTMSSRPVAGGGMQSGAPDGPSAVPSSSGGSNSGGPMGGFMGDGRQQLEPRGTVHVMAGTGGADYSMGDYHPQPWSAARSEGVHGYLSIHASSSGLMLLFINSSDGDVLDRATIPADRRWVQRCEAAPSGGLLMRAGHMRHGDGRVPGFGPAMVVIGGGVVAVALAVALVALVASVRNQCRRQHYDEPCASTRLIQPDKEVEPSDKWDRLAGGEPGVDAA
eukprot:jgi/Mesvir1/19281/Mv10357-RA.1